MDKGITKIINSYITYLLKEQIIFEKAYLFGSYATSKQTKQSDIDIALIFSKNIINDRFDLQVKLLTLASDIDTRIEPHPISIDDFNSDNPFSCEIIKTGKEIKINLPSEG
jgi:uncharacterized protein